MEKWKVDGNFYSKITMMLDVAVILCGITLMMLTRRIVLLELDISRLEQSIETLNNKNK